MSLSYPDGIPVTLCPPGMAWGCFDLRNRGRGADYNNITVWPTEHYRLFTGGDRKWRDINLGNLHQQEIYVYLRELGQTIQDAFDSLKTEVVEELQTCAYCKAQFGCSRKKKYCTRSCCFKAQRWGTIAQYEAEMTQEMREAFQDYKPKIFKHRKSWRIGVLNDSGTYQMIGRRFNSFDDAAKVSLLYARSKSR